MVFIITLRIFINSKNEIFNNLLYALLNKIEGVSMLGEPLPQNVLQAIV